MRGEESLQQKRLMNERKHPKGFGGRILKVGKDVTMMSTLLHALQRDGEQKQTETLNHRTTQRIAKKNISNCNKSFSWESEIFSFLQRSQFSKAFALRQRAGSPRSIR